MTATETRTTRIPPDDISELGAWLDDLIHEIDEQPDDVRDRVYALLDGIDVLHRSALTRVVALLQAPGAGLGWKSARADPVIRTVLQLYDLLPESADEQVEDALRDVQGKIGRDGGKLELLKVAEGVVSVRLNAPTKPGADSTVEWMRTIEDALREGFPGFLAIQVAGPPTPPRPTIRLSVVAPPEQPPIPRPLNAPRWDDLTTLDELPPATMRGFQGRGTAILVVNVGGTVFAYEDACPDTPMLLSIGQLDGEEIVCPWHGCRFDARVGTRLLHRGTNLIPYPTDIQGNAVRVAVNLRGVAHLEQQT